MAILARYGFSNPRVFGSIARGTDTPSSDLDLLVDASSSTTILDVIGAELDIKDLIGAKVDLIIDRNLRPTFAAKAHRDMVPLTELLS